MIRNYGKCEFCDAMKCKYYRPESKDDGFAHCYLSRNSYLSDECPFTAKQFHSWLKKNKFDIIRKVA